MTDKNDIPNQELFPEIKPSTHDVYISLLRSPDGVTFPVCSPYAQQHIGDNELLSSTKITMTEGEFIGDTEEKS